MKKRRMKMISKLKTLSEYLSEKDVWQAIYDIKPYSFITDPVDMTAMQTIEYGQRSVLTAFDNIPASLVAKYIVAIYGSKWDNLLHIETLGMNMAAGATQSVKGSQSSNVDQTGTTNTTNKVGAYNSDTLIDDSGADNNSATETVTTKTNDSEMETISYENLFNNLSLEQQTNILKVAKQDVASYLTLSIYS